MMTQDSGLPREFQFWEYRVSHGSLLVRSPSSPDFQENVDFEFHGVVFVQMTRHLGNVSLCSPTPEEENFVEGQMGRTLGHTAKLYVLSDGCRRHLVAAAAVRMGRNKLGMFDSPFDI